MEKLTTKQEMILQIIKKWIAQYGYPPTVREIGEQAHLNSPATIHFHLTKLEEKGYITKGNGKNRTIEVLVPNEYLEKDENVVEVPLLGKVTAGNPIEAIEMPDEYVALLRAEQVSRRFTVTGILLDKGKSAMDFSLKPFCQTVYRASELTGDEIVQKLVAQRV